MPVTLMHAFFFTHSTYQFLMWLSLGTLFLHQLEEYRFPGTFPAMLNRVMFKSDHPLYYPLNTNTALVINVGIGWLSYFLAAVFAERFLWLGLATILVSCGNVVAHLLLFNAKAKSFYNAGMATSIFLFAPCTFYFFKIADLDLSDWLLGVVLGLALNYLGIIKTIVWMADEQTDYVFDDRFEKK